MEDWARESRKRLRNEPITSMETEETASSSSNNNPVVTMKDIGYSQPYRNIEVIIEGLDRYVIKYMCEESVMKN